MNITTELEKTSKKIHTVWKNISKYCAGRPCVRCLLDNGRGLCVANLMVLIEGYMEKLKDQKNEE